MRRLSLVAQIWKGCRFTYRTSTWLESLNPFQGTTCRFFCRTLPFNTSIRHSGVPPKHDWAIASDALHRLKPHGNVRLTIWNHFKFDAWMKLSSLILSSNNDRELLFTFSEEVSSKLKSITQLFPSAALENSRQVSQTMDIEYISYLCSLAQVDWWYRGATVYNTENTSSWAPATRAEVEYPRQQSKRISNRVNGRMNVDSDIWSRLTRCDPTSQSGVRKIKSL